MDEAAGPSLCSVTAEPATVAMRIGAVESTGVAVTVEDVITAGMTGANVQVTSNWSPV